MSSKNSNVVTDSQVQKAVSNLQSAILHLPADMKKQISQASRQVQVEKHPGYGTLLESYRKVKTLVKPYVSNAYKEVKLVDIAPKIVPGLSSEVLLRRSKYQIIPYEGAFHYFKLPSKFVKNGHFYELEYGRIPYIADSLVVIDKELYIVTKQDALKNFVRASRKLNARKTTLTYEAFENGTIYPETSSNLEGNSAEGENASGAISPSAHISGEVGEENLAALLSGRAGAQINSDKSKLNRDFELEDAEVADLLYEKQKRSLFDLISQEEGEVEWEIEEGS